MKKYDYYYKRKSRLENYRPIKNIDSMVFWVCMTPCIFFYLVLCAFKGMG